MQERLWCYLISPGLREPQRWHTAEERVIGASGLTCMLAVVECGISLESVGERTENRGEDALASAGEG